MAPIPRSALLARALRARTGPVRQSFNRLSRRSYASGNNHGHTSGSELPWILGASAATAGGVWVLWPEPPKYGKGGHEHGHGDHSEEHEEKEDDQSEETKQDEPEAQASSSDGKEEESKPDDDKDQKSQENADEGSNEKSEDDKESKEEPEKGTKENPIVNEDRDDGNREIKYKDSKGGNKKRLESTNAIKQGNKGDDPKGASANVHSGQGEHAYNTDTKHSIDAQADPGISNKGEGDPETAKLKTPVDPNRPQK